MQVQMQVQVQMQMQMQMQMFMCECGGGKRTGVACGIKLWSMLRVTFPLQVGLKVRRPPWVGILLFN